MKIFKALFGGAWERLEDSGDELVSGSKWCEASWFYREALRSVPAEDAEVRGRLEEKEAAAARRALEDLLARAEASADAANWDDGLRLLDEAAPYARSEPEQAMLRSRVHWIRDLQEFRRPAEEPSAPAQDDAARFRRALTRLSREEADRILRLGDSGRRGYLMLLDGDFNGAREHLDVEVRTNPDSASARELRARALENLGRLEDAQAEFDEALRRDPGHLPLILESARFRRDRRNDAAGALRHIEAACRLHPPHRETMAIHLERVVLLAETGRCDEARGAIERLFDIPDLDRGTLLFNRAGILEALELHGEALRDLQAAVEISPSNVMYLERLADMLFRHGDAPEEALACLDRALSLDSHDFSARRRHGKFSPNRARLLYKMSRLGAVLGDFDGALARADEALTVCSDPDVQEAILDLRRELHEFQADGQF